MGSRSRPARLDIASGSSGACFFDKLAPFPAGSLPLARELGMAGKILLGSDFPNLPYPYARQLAGLARAGPGCGLAARGVLGQPGGDVRAT